MTIQQIYDHYRILPMLQLHQLRVAGVARFIAGYLKTPVDMQLITEACLLHDMGNIIKFDLLMYPDFLKPDGYEYWFQVQSYFKQRYGENEFQANLKIAQEIGLRPEVQEIIGSISFTHVIQNFESENMALKISDYADTRVSPLKVVSLEERFVDLETRYGKRYSSEDEQRARKQFQDVMLQIQDQIFNQVSDITPQLITDEAINPLLESLRTTEITTVNMPVSMVAAVPATPPPATTSVS